MTFNVNGLTLIGEGHHGKVYRLDETRCIKIYNSDKFRQMEYEVLKLSERFSFFPRVYECKDEYMIREYFHGPNLWEFLHKNDLTKDIVEQLLAILDAFVNLGYSKIDIHLHHIIVTRGQRLKIIDPTTNMSRKSSYPRVLLKQLEELGYKYRFLAYTRILRPKYYEKWQKY